MVGFLDELGNTLPPSPSAVDVGPRRLDQSFKSSNVLQSSTANIEDGMQADSLQSADLVEEQGPDALYVDAYPIEQRVKYAAKLKADKLVGKAPTRKPQTVEQHFDDCGSDFGPISFVDDALGDVFEDLTCHVVTDTEQRDVLDTDTLEQLENMVHPFFGLAGCDAEDESTFLVSDHRNIVRYDDLDVFLSDSRFPSTGYVDVAELCGGGALTTKLLVRRGYVGGTNFDIVVGFDLDTAAGERGFFEYLHRCKPYVLIMGPPCTGMKGFKELNNILYPETFWKSRLRSERIGTIAGKAATLQMDEFRHFFNEQPRGSDLYKLPVWQRLAHRVAWCFVQQCAAGLRGIRTGRPIRKDSEFWGQRRTYLEIGTQVRLCLS